ncbi:MAG: protoporphyrinogen oxidase [Actinomycetota bacterium]
MSDRAPRRVVVIGGGVTGLTTAYRLTRAHPSLDVTVLEANDRPGGKLRSTEVGGLVLPAGADSFVARKPWAVDLCKELGLGSELVSPASGGAFIWTERGLRACLRDAPFGIPGDVGDVFRWPGISRAGRRRALLDLVKTKRQADDDETLGSLLRRRLGDEVTDLAVGPLLAGLFAGDVDRLSVRATFPELEVWERSQGSLIRGSQAASRNVRGGTPPPMFVKPRGGVDRLTDALAEQLGARVRTGIGARAIAEAPGGWRVELGGDAGTIVADAVVLATPGPVTAGILEATAPEVAGELAGVRYSSTGVILMVYPEGTQPAIQDGSGFVVPRGKAPMTACTWVSSKWPSGSFGSRAVVRCYVGAVGEEDILDAGDEELIEACARHLAAVLPLPDAPDHAAVVRWPASMPQFELGHVERVGRIREALPEGIFVVGQPYDGVGVPDCVRGAGETAEQVAAHLADAPMREETVR